MMSQIAVELDNLSKMFRLGENYRHLRDLVPALVRQGLRGRGGTPKSREFWALQDVSFQVTRGEAFAIIGGNGAGKSTMLKLLSGIMRPTRGTIHVAGRLSALIEISAGFHPDLSGRENIYLNGAIMGMRRSEITRRFDEIVAFSGLEKFLDTPVKRYSSGMFARLGFSIAAHVDADILLVDEVLSVGDYLFQQRCVERMNEVLRSGATILFVSHNLRAVAELCQRALLLERGRVATIGPTNDVIRAYLERGIAGRDSQAAIAGVRMEGVGGALVEFESGERVKVAVDIVAWQDLEDMSVVISVRDEQDTNVFDTCTHRLGGGPLSLRRGEAMQCTFELSLDLAQGTYFINTYLHHYVTDKPHEVWERAVTFFVRQTPEMRGIANLRPALGGLEQRSTDLQVAGVAAFPPIPRAEPHA